MDEEIKRLCDVIRQTGYEIYKYHGPGHLEKIYENALVHRLTKVGLQVVQQEPLRVYDEDATLLGEYFADILVDGKIIIELKCAKAIAPEHEAQIIGYLKSSRMQHGMILNLGAPRFQVRKYIWSGLL